MALYCYLTSAAAVWLIGRRPLRAHGGGKRDGVALSPSDSYFFVASGGYPQRRVSRLALRGVNTAECSGFFHKQHNGPLSHYRQVANHLPGQKSPHRSASGGAQTRPTPSCQTPLYLIIESVLAPHCAPCGSSAHNMATEREWFSVDRSTHCSRVGCSVRPMWNDALCSGGSHHTIIVLHIV